MIKQLLTFTACAAFLAIPTGSALAQNATGGEASIETGASYSSRRGGIAFIGLNADNLFGRGIDIRLGYQASQDGRALNANVSQTYQLGQTALGQDTYLRGTLTGRASDWSSQDYSLAHYGAEITAGAETASGLHYRGRIFWQSDSVDDFDEDISPLAAIPLDNSTAIGVGVGLGYSTFTDTNPLATGLNLQGNVTLATPLGDREWVAAEVSGQYNAAIADGMVLALAAETGQINGRNGQDVHIADRAFIGNPMPRGFAYTGIGPRDVSGDRVDTALGGNSYLTSSAELRIATPYPAVVVGIFADAGALWDLDETEGGASAVIDDSYALRTSAGLSVYWDTQIGLVQINAAKPIAKQDNDKIENFSINLNFQF